MTPAEFVHYVSGIAKKNQFPFSNIILGGDHLGPNVWQNESAESALQKSGVRLAAEDWTAFFHLTPLGNDHELLGRMGQAITAHAYPPPVWSSPGEVVVDYAQFSAANLAAGSYVVWMGMYPPFTKVRATVAAEIVVVSEARARLVEFQLAL